MRAQQVFAVGWDHELQRDFAFAVQEPRAVGKEPTVAGHLKLLRGVAARGGGQRAFEFDGLDPNGAALHGPDPTILDIEFVDAPTHAAIGNAEPVPAGGDADAHLEALRFRLGRGDFPFADHRVVDHRGGHDGNFGKRLVGRAVFPLGRGPGLHAQDVVAGGKIRRGGNGVLLQRTERHPAVAAVALGVEADGHQVGAELLEARMRNLRRDRLVGHAARGSEIFFE